VADNLNNASPKVEGRIRELAGEEAGARLDVRVLDLLDESGLAALCAEKKFDCCIHFAGYKAVGESVAKPLAYYRNNMVSTMNLVECLQAHGCRRLIFSSSATVYGEPEQVPIDEKARLTALNPYGRTKLYQEEMFRDLCISDGAWEVALLRYFNPVAAHPSGRLGEDPKGIPNNLMPYVQQVAVGRRAELSVFGNDYPTPDGTGVRDYIHVVDLAEGHAAAVNNILAAEGKLGCVAYNLGTGNGTSVLEIVKAFSAACGKEIPYKFAPRRPGDATAVYATPSFAEKELGWKATRTLEDMCRDQWNWASNNPYGYEGKPEEN
jgi:UDP-glucose 4-epimerase